MQAATAAVCSWVQRPCHVQKTLTLQSSLTSVSNNLSTPSSAVAHEPRAERLWFRGPVVSEHLTVTFTLSLPFNQVWISPLTDTHRTQGLLFRAPRATVIRGCRDAHLWNSLILCALGKIIVIASPLGPVSSQPWILHSFKVWGMFVLLWSGFNFHQDIVGYPHKY